MKALFYNFLMNIKSSIVLILIYLFSVIFLKYDFVISFLLYSVSFIYIERKCSGYYIDFTGIRRVDKVNFSYLLVLILTLTNYVLMKYNVTNLSKIYLIATEVYLIVFSIEMFTSFAFRKTIPYFKSIMGLLVIVLNLVIQDFVFEKIIIAIGIYILSWAVLYIKEVRNLC